MLTRGPGNKISDSQSKDTPSGIASYQNQKGASSASRDPPGTAFMRYDRWSEMACRLCANSLGKGGELA